MIKTLTGINLNKNKDISCNRCENSIISQIVKEDELEEKKKIKKIELSAKKKNELVNLCNELNLRNTGNKPDLVERITEVFFITKANKKKMDDEILSFFKNAGTGHSSVSYQYGRYFNQVDRFNVLFYENKPSIYRGTFQGKWLLDILHVCKINLYALYQYDRLNRRVPTNPDKIKTFINTMCVNLLKTKKNKK